MASIINTNLQSINAQRNLLGSQNSMNVSMQRLSSGLRVNSAKDDAAGLSIATRMDAQARGMTVATRNANDGISMAQTAESALGSVTDSLQRMRELAVQARNSTNSEDDLKSLDQEFKALGDEIERVLNGTTFNGKTILGDDAATFTFQVGANTTDNDVIEIETNEMVEKDNLKLVIGSGAQNSIAPTATDAADLADKLGTVIEKLDLAIDEVNSERATYGAAQSRFDAVITNLSSAIENQTAARSRIMDADFAVESANLARTQVLQQAGNAMVAMANQAPQQVLALLPR